MLRMSRLTDYATVILAYMARDDDDALHTTSDVAKHTHLATTTVSKLLKTMTRAGLIASYRGSNGGYRLARPAREISAAEIIDALEGPVSITECSAESHRCDLAEVCGVGNAWQRINVAIRAGLDEISLEQLVRPGTHLAPFELSDGPNESKQAHQL
ncbi:MAG: SUF system Fe-S cluster assembly regulator [Gammaproteobacteria bacterium]|nr:SUF system Fe-S cluster assembly regulator [Gammaproteobacteria bacterium]